MFAAPALGTGRRRELAGLGTFMAIATPLWREGQPPVLIALIGLLAGLAMAFVMALVSGLALARIVEA